MAVTRIKNNQITDATVVANAKLVDYSISSAKLANDLVYNSNFTVSGNLTVTGNTTTIDTTITTIEDPVIVLASTQTTGTPVVDIGYLGYRGDQSNIAFVWDESADEFVTAFTSSGETNTTVTITTYANFHTNDANIGGNIVINGTTSMVGNLLSANVTGTLSAGNLSTAGTLSVTGNITGGNINTAGAISATGNITGNYFIGNGALLTGIDTTLISNGNSNVQVYANGDVAVSIAGVSNTVIFTSTGVQVTGTVSASGNVTGANLFTAGSVSATGNVTGGNIDTVGLVSAGNVSTAGNVTGGNLLFGSGIVSGTGNVYAANFIGNISGNIDAGGANTQIQFNDDDVLAGSPGFTFDKVGNVVTANGNITGANLFTGGTVSATGNVFGDWFIGNVDATTVSATGTVSGGNVLSGGVVSATGTVTGGNIATSGTVSATGTVTGGNIATSGTVSATGTATVGNLATAGTVSATGTVTGGNVLTGGLISSTGNITGGNVLTNGLISAQGTITATDSITGGNVLTGGLISATGNAIAGNILTAGTVSATGTVQGGNIATAGDVSATGSLTGGNIYTGGLVSAVSTITGGNLATAGTITATGTVTGGNLATAGTITATGTVTGGNLATGGTVSATGNVTGGNVSTTGNITGSNVIATNAFVGNIDLTGNATVNSLLSNTIVSAGGNVTGANILTGGLISATGNITGNYFFGNGSQLTGIDTNLIKNGDSNVRILTANGNITMDVNGTSNVVVVTQTGIDVTGTVSASGNITGQNLFTGGSVSATGNVTANNVNTANVISTGGVTITAASGDIVLDPSGNIVMDGGKYINNVNNPVQAQDAATKQYVDDAVSAGIQIHQPVYLEANTAVGGTYAQGGNTYTVSQTIAGNTVVFSTAANLQPNDQLWFSNSFSGIQANVAYFVVSAPNTSSAILSTSYDGAPVSNITSATGLTQGVRVNSGVGATLTNSGANATLVIDGVTTTNGMRVLIYSEANAVHNGVYVVSEAGNATTAWQLTRSTDTNKYGPKSINELDAGDYFFVQAGDSGAGESYVMTAPTGAFIIGYDNLTFTQFSASQVYTANTNAGLSLTGTVFSAKVDNNTTAFDGGGNIIVKAGANLTTPNIGAATGTSLSVTGNINGGNVFTTGVVSATGNITGNYFIGNGSQLTGVTASSVDANALTGNTLSSNVLFSSLTTVGTLTSLSVSGNVDSGNLLTGGLISATSTITSGANITGGNLLTSGEVSATSTVTGGNLATGGTVSATGTATVGNLSTAGSVTATGTITGGNVLTGGVVSATGTGTFGNVTTAGSVSATGTVQGGNVLTAGEVSAGGSLTGGNIYTGGTVSAVATITGGNLATGGTVSATGNITGGNITTAGEISSTGTATTGNLVTGGIITATGNISSANTVSGANLATSGTVSATGNVIGGNVTTGGTVSATGTVTGGNLTTGGTVSATGTGTFGNVATSGTVSATGNITGGNIDTAGLLSGGNISTAGNVTGGNIDTAGLLSGGNISTAGNVTGGNLLFGSGIVSGTGNVYAANFIGNISGNIDAGGANTQIQFNDDDVLAGSPGFTFDKVGNVVTANGNITGANLFTGGTVSATGNLVGGNITTGGSISATGNITGNYFFGNGSQLTGIDTNLIKNGDSNVRILTANGNITMDVNGTSNVVVVTQNGLDTSNVSATGNITGSNINTAGLITATGNIYGGNLILAGAALDTSAARLTVNSTLADADFAVNGTAANVFYIDAGSNTASFGSSSQVTNAIVNFATTTSVKMPVGNTIQRPGTGVTGMVRFNTTLNKLEVYDNSQWSTVGDTQFTVIADEQFNGDGSTVAFTLATSQTTNSCIVSINGVVQIPTIAYSVSGTTLTFTEAPLTGDLIDVREITTTTTVTSITNVSGNATVSVSDTSATVLVTGDLSVTGNVNISGNVATNQINNGTSAVQIPTSGGNVNIDVGAVDNMTVFTSTGAFINGNLSVTGNVTAQDVNSLSDVTLKTNIQPISGIESVLFGLNGYEYDWKNGSGHSYGFLAQEVEKVLPNAVKTGQDGLKAINYMMIIPFLVETIKQMGTEIKDLKQTVSKSRGKKK